MSADVTSNQAPEKQDSPSMPVPQSAWWKFLYGLFIVVMPILAFWSTDLFKPDWQTGKLSDYLILLLFPEASLLFIFLLMYSVACYWLLLVDADRYSQRYIVRLGLYTGALLGFQYAVLSALYFYDNSNSVWAILFLIMLWVLPFIVPKTYLWLVNRWRADRVRAVLLGLCLLLLLVSSVLMKNPLYPVVLVLVGVTMAAPFWCFLIFLRAAIWSFRTYPHGITLPQGLGLAAWIASYAAAWRFDILKMYELYAALPPEPPPDCYIATAAARGHPKVVGSWQVKRSSGETLHVNQQLQILKCAELALLAVLPHFHNNLRRLYDNLGKSLAAYITNPWWADLAYFLLKPFEWLARLVLRILLVDVDLLSNKMYMH